jgi:hypothetical protein
MTPAEGHPPPAKQKVDPGPFLVRCPGCAHMWTLQTIDVRIASCDSGGIYSAYLRCPRCHHEQNLL